MKYLRKYQENSNKELKDFCKSYLSYLIDDGFDISFNSRMNMFNFFKTESVLEFKWDDIRDEFIPFLEVLVTQYNIDANITAEIVHGAYGDVTTPKQIKLKELLDDSEYLHKLTLRLILIPVG